MSKNFRPIVFLLVLFAVALFLIGFRLGKNVERLDKSFVAISPIPPPPAGGSPTTTPLNLTTHSNSDCGVSYLAPDDQNIFVSCDQIKVLEFKEEVKTATPEAIQTIKNQKVSLYKGKGESKRWTMLNPLNAKTLIFEVNDNLTDLILKTVEFVK